MDCEKFKNDIVRWCINQGPGWLFEDCGLGKTLQKPNEPGEIVVVEFPCDSYGKTKAEIDDDQPEEELK